MVHADEVQEIFEKILPDATIARLVNNAGFQERDRKLNALVFTRAMIIAAATKYGGCQADVMRAYFQSGGTKVVRGAFYRWFGKELETVMDGVAQNALEFARFQPVDLPGWLGKYVNDWHIMDSTTVKLDKSLEGEYPGTGDYAALKVHKRFSVGVGTTVNYTISAARDHDNKHFKLDETWRGLGLLADLGYASFKLLRDCNCYDVRYVIRLMESWKPKVLSIEQGTLKGPLVRGVDFDVVLTKTLKCDGRIVDMQVELGQGEGKVEARLVGVPAPNSGYRFYLTNLPRAIHPKQIAILYRVRWEIEMDNKLNKSSLHLDEIGSKTGPAARAMVHAAIVSSMIACLITHKARLRDAPAKGEVCERTTAPLHPRLVAMAIGSGAVQIAMMMDQTKINDSFNWETITANIAHTGKDPNWRCRPSILDELRGWKTPARSKISQNRRETYNAA